MVSFTVPPRVASRIAHFAFDRPTLAVLARTSRSFQEPAEKLLYDYIELFPHTCNFFLLETLAECPRVAAYVRQYVLTANQPYRVSPTHERELRREIEAVAARREFWERVSASLVHLRDLDLLILVDSRASNSWILDNARRLRARQLQLGMQWDEHTVEFVKTQDRVQSLTITEVAENAPLGPLPPTSLPCLSTFEGPIMLVDLLLHCPLTHLKFPVDSDEALSMLPLVLAELNNFKKLRALSITMLPPENLVSSMSIITNSCPNLQYISHLPLPMDHKSHVTFLSCLSQLPNLKALEFDVQHWNPALTPPFQRAVAASLHMVLPKLSYVFFWGRYERTLWTWAPEEVEPIEVRAQPSFSVAVDQQDGGNGTDRGGSGREGLGLGAGMRAGIGTRVAAGAGAASVIEETTSYVGLEGWRHDWGNPVGYANSSTWKTLV